MRFGVLVASIVSAWVVPSAVHAARVFVDAGTLTASVAAGLVKESAETRIAGDEASADAIVRVKTRERGLELAVLAGDGDALLVRRIELAKDAAPAVRVIVLLAAEVLADARAPARAPAHKEGGEGSDAPGDRARASITAPAETSALETPKAAPSDPIAPAAPTPADASLDTAVRSPAASVAAEVPAPATPGTLRISGGFASALWARPSSIEPGAFLAAHTPLTDSITLGGHLTLLGLGCCTIESAGAISATPSAITLAADANLALARFDPFELALALSLGVTRRSADVVSLAYRGVAPVQSSSAFEGMARAGLALEPRWGRFLLHLAAGAELRAPRLGVDLPPPYAQEMIALDPGLVTVWVELGAGAILF